MKAHTLVAFGGTLPLGEEWSITARVLSPGLLVPIAEASLEEYLKGPNPGSTLGGIAAGMAGIFSGSGAAMGNQNRLTWAKANNIGSDGKYSQPTTHVWDYPTPIIGGGASSGPPAMCTVAWSWGSTAKRRGPASRGRVYPPNNGLNQVTNPQGIIASSAQTSQLAAAKAFLSMLATGSGTITAVPVLISTVSDAYSVIDEVRVGRVWDVQRRRKNQITEDYVTGVWP